jgi:glycosyltransferase involved in cell wall biosynthesis
MVTVEHHSLGLRAPSDNVNSASALLWSKASVFLTEDYLVGYPLKSSKLRGLRTRAVIANGVDLAPFSLGQRRPRSVEKIPILGMAARLVPSKNVDTILDAVVILAEAQSSKTPHLRLAGDGPERSRLESRVTELGIGDYVSFLGHVPESQLPTFFSGLDIYVLSTMGEAFNTSLLQAAAAQVPIVATRVPGVTDLFTDGVDAILVEPRDPWSLTAAILEAADPVVAHRIAKAAFELVSSRYTASSMVRAYLRLLVRVDPNGPWLKSEGRMGGEPGMWNAT